MPTPRPGGTRLALRNSGHELWLYDDSNRAAIRAAGPGMGGAPGDIPGLMRQGLLLGVSLPQDDDVDLEVHVGQPLSRKELGKSHWLEPQSALLRLPSGALAVEPNDASRIGPDAPTETGGRMSVAPGDYRVTLYRIDDEALFRDGQTWDGPAEVLVLTPGGTPSDAADDLLPFEERRDTSWVGRYTIEGRTARALVWLDDYWDTFTLNLDAAALGLLGVARGSYLRTTIPAAELTFVSAFGSSWQDAQGVAPPDGIDISEYGYAALSPMSEWGGAEALFCRRETSKTKVPARLHGLWSEARVEVLDARPKTLEGRGFVATDLATKDYFDAGFLAMVLGDLLPEVADLDELPLSKALGRLDRKLAKMGLTPQGDVSWQERIRMQVSEMSARLYAGPPDHFAAVVAGDGQFTVVLISEADDGTWVATGMADELESKFMKKDERGLPTAHPTVRLTTLDESLARIAAAHKKALKGSRAKTAPSTRDECVAALGRFLDAGFS